MQLTKEELKKMVFQQLLAEAMNNAASKKALLESKQANIIKTEEELIKTIIAEEIHNALVSK